MIFPNAASLSPPTSGDVPREKLWTLTSEKLQYIEEFAQYMEHFPTALILKNGKLMIDYEFFSGNNIVMYLDPKDLRTAPFDISVYGTYERFEAFLLHSIATEIETFIDVGANIGFYSLSVSKLNQDCKVFAFEPNPTVYNRLVENISLNGLSEKISPFNSGLGKVVDAQLDFFIPNFTGSGGGSLKDLHPEEGKSTKVKVKLSKMDSMFSKKKVDLIKIDVEGNEFDVILGALETLKYSKPIIFIELLRKWMRAFKHHPQEIIEVLTKQGYVSYGIQTAKLIKIKQIDENTVENNFIFCHKEDTKTNKFLESFVDGQ